ncbi:hypothetical protein D3C72_1426660 [compost metagenome]
MSFCVSPLANVHKTGKVLVVAPPNKVETETPNRFPCASKSAVSIPDFVIRFPLMFFSIKNIALLILVASCPINKGAKYVSILSFILSGDSSP